MRKLIKTAVAALLAAALLAGSAMAAYVGEGKVTASGLNLRLDSSTSSGIVTVIPNGGKLSIVEASGDWYRVDYNGVKGYVYADYVDYTALSSGASAETTTIVSTVPDISAADGNLTIGGGTVTASALNFRSGPGTAYSVNGVIPYGSFVLVTEKSGSWYKVCYNGTEGYVSGNYLSFSVIANGNGGTGTVAGSDVRLRSEPSLSGNILGSVNNGDKLSITGVSGQWVKVKKGSTEAYIYSKYLKSAASQLLQSSAVQTPAYSGTGEQIVATAKQYLGCPYVWAGMSPAGFDCSGFVNYIYKLHGYSMNRVAQAIYSNDGSYVSKSELQPGDLVFFGYSAYNVTHVGMYIGNGQFIHASSSSGQVVITDLNSNYYTRMYVGAKRIA